MENKKIKYEPTSEYEPSGFNRDPKSWLPYTGPKLKWNPKIYFGTEDIVIKEEYCNKKEEKNGK